MSVSGLAFPTAFLSLYDWYVPFDVCYLCAQAKLYDFVFNAISFLLIPLFSR